MEAIKTAKDGRQYTVINGKAVFIKGSKPVVKAAVEMAPALVTPIADTKGIACGNCKGKHTSIEDVRNCFGVTVVNTKWTARPTAVVTDLDKKVMVTCGWGKASHKVEMTKADAIAFRNTCEQHR
jgi:hypothetical protein